MGPIQGQGSSSGAPRTHRAAPLYRRAAERGGPTTGGFGLTSATLALVCGWPASAGWCRARGDAWPRSRSGCRPARAAPPRSRPRTLPGGCAAGCRRPGEAVATPPWKPPTAPRSWPSPTKRWACCPPGGRRTGMTLAGSGAGTTSACPPGPGSAGRSPSRSPRRGSPQPVTDRPQSAGIRHALVMPATRLWIIQRTGPVRRPGPGNVTAGPAGCGSVRRGRGVRRDKPAGGKG